eukprot:4065112-Pleurochrysis_carterae.AAC.1
MMMVGHTHEDIDALFRRIAEYWARQGRVSTPSAFMRYLREAIPSSTVHPLVEYVHDWASFFKDQIYDAVEGINDAREFIIKERDDGGKCQHVCIHCTVHATNAMIAKCGGHVCISLLLVVHVHFCLTVAAMWYKPYSSHPHLYPAAKDADGNPIEKSQTVNGEKEYAVCPHGIEIFKTREGPQGFPALASFAKNITNANLPRFDIANARRSTLSILDVLKDRFTAAEKQEWETFFDEYPQKVEDIPAERVHNFSATSLPKCGMQLPDSASLGSHL